MTGHVVIVGGGFAGIYTAWRLASDGGRVTLVEAADHIGGTLWSLDWNGWLVDIGAHHLDTRSALEHAFYSDILGDDLVPMQDHDWASTLGHAITPGFENPDLTGDPLCDAALADVLAQADSPDATGPRDSYRDWLVGRYGTSLADRLAQMAAKVIGAPIDGLQAQARDGLSMFSRIKLGPDPAMAALKATQSVLDQRLAVSAHHGDARFAGKSASGHVFHYPHDGALRRFCSRAAARLVDLGVDLRRNSTVTGIAPRGAGAMVTLADGTMLSADRLFWTLADQGLLDLLGSPLDLRPAVQPVGAAIHAFEVDRDTIAGPDYMHDFTTQRVTYRYARTGVYSHQTRPDGRSFVIGEVPCHPANRLQAAAQGDRVWSDLTDSGYLHPGAQCYARAVWTYPVAFTLPRMGWQPLMMAVEQDLRARAPGLVRIEYGHRGRYGFMLHYDDRLAAALKGDNDAQG